MRHPAPSGRDLRVLFALPGLHALDRGAEVAFESVAEEIAKRPGYSVSLIGSGQARPGRSYRFLHAGCRSRDRFEHWPRVPVLRNEYVYEELTFTAGLLRQYQPDDYDVTVTCSYPFTNWVLRARARWRRPAHVYVTQNGDWPCQQVNSEYRLFGCDGLICTNPEYYETNRRRWRCRLIPNGVDPDRFRPGPADPDRFNLIPGLPVVIMVSALIPTKRVVEGIRYAARLDDVQLVAAGDGPLRDEVRSVGRELLGERFQSVVLPRDAMPDLYRCADVFMHMSQIEPSANAYIEALASGLPIVTHDREVTRWTLEDTAVLVDSGDGEAVVDGVRRALRLKRPKDVEARRRLVARRFTWSAIAESYCDFFHEMLEARRAPGNGTRRQALPPESSPPPV